jgi:hypothetical protein
MKRLPITPNIAGIGLARSVLDSAQIMCEVRNEAVSQAMVGLPFAPELWVRDEDYEEAMRLLAEMRRDKNAA